MKYKHICQYIYIFFSSSKQSENAESEASPLNKEERIKTCDVSTSPTFSENNQSQTTSSNGRNCSHIKSYKHLSKRKRYYARRRKSKNDIKNSLHVFLIKFLLHKN